MKLSCRNSLMILLVALALMMSTVGITPAFADEETPPPPATEEPTLPPTEEPAAEQTAADPTEDPALPSTAEPAPEETATVSALLEQLPTDTSLILLGEGGEALPLASGEAVDVLVSGDPMWCPAGVTPGNDPSGECTDQYASLSELITELHNDQDIYNGSGTIYIAWDYNASDASSPDHGVNVTYAYNLSRVTDLTVQGGWVFDDPATPEVEDYLGSEPSDLTGINSLNFLDWGGDEWVGSPASLTINNIVINDAGWNGWMFGGGLYVGEGWLGSTSSNVTLSNVSVTSSTENGATIITESGNISVTDSTFSDNASDGLYAEAGGNVTLDAVTANANGENGAELSAEGDISISDTTFNGNSDSGVSAQASGSVTLDNVIATGNDTGAFLAATTVAQAFCSTFSSNNWGVDAATPDLYLNEVTFSGNTSGDYINSGGNIWVNQYDCNPVPPPEPVPPSGPVIQGAVTASENQTVLYIVIAQTQEQLPVTLGNGNAFASALKLVLTQAGEAAGIRAITLAFPIPDGMQDAKLAVVFWNGSGWADVPGGVVVGDFLVITVGQPGVYVLVSR